MYRRLGLMATASSGKNYKNDRPPNILIFTKGNPEEFNKWKHHFQNFVEPDRYCLIQYHNFAILIHYFFNCNLFIDLQYTN